MEKRSYLREYVLEYPPHRGEEGQDEGKEGAIPK